MTTTQPVTGIKQKISTDALEDCFELFKKSTFRHFEKETGQPPVFYSLTFEHDDYERHLMTFDIASGKPKYLHITAPENEIEETIKKVQEANPHLKLTYNMMGWNNEDFMRGYVTIRMNVD